MKHPGGVGIPSGPKILTRIGEVGVEINKKYYMYPGYQNSTPVISW